MIKIFTIFETRREILVNKDVLIGTFEVNVTAVTLDSFTVRAYTLDQYVVDVNNFVALTNQNNNSNCKLAIFSNQNPEGEEVTTQLFNNSTLIVFHPETSSFERTTTITVYMLQDQIESLQGSTCQMPIFFKIEGL